MSTFTIRIERSAAVSGAPLAYFVHVDVDSGLAGVTAGAGATCDTPALALREVSQRLDAVTGTDEIVYRDGRYATVGAAIAAIEADRVTWE